MQQQGIKELAQSNHEFREKLDGLRKEMNGLVQSSENKIREL
ncbi:hypothetical protein [Candidatus Wolbachia massiliensis]|nr:hypothetical protein [Candidatus Wolbachia massiliensis]